MALVRISKELINKVEARINAMAQTELKLYPGSTLTPEVGSEDFAKYTEIATEAMWSIAPALRGVMPKEWCIAPRNIDLYYAPAGSTQVHIRLLGVSNVVAPPNSGSYPDVFIRTFHPEMDALLQQVRVGVVERQCITNKYRNIRAQVVGFLHAQPSLNRALEKHPEIALYIDQEYIDRVNAKEERKGAAKPQREEVTIDVDAITSAAIAHRLATAGGSA